MYGWDWVGIVSPIEGEASSSSQFQSSISESGYSGVFTLGSSRLESQLVAGSSFTLISGSTNTIGGWSAMGLGLPKAVVTLQWASGSPRLLCRTVLFWEWVGMVTDLEGEASNSSQFQSSISESGYSGMLASESSRLESQLVAGSDV